jgi:hypothetical protein
MGRGWNPSPFGATGEAKEAILPFRRASARIPYPGGAAAEADDGAAEAGPVSWGANCSNR